jgi:predicted RNase H-like nuclease (RuvC/YqgF family)
MTVEATGRQRFQFSLASILVLTALTAILLVPLAWVTRERQQMLLAQAEVLRAREEAVRAVVLAERAAAATAVRVGAAGSKTGAALLQSAKTNESTDLVERLKRENAELKAKVETLRQEVERLKAAEKH